MEDHCSSSPRTTYSSSSFSYYSFDDSHISSSSSSSSSEDDSSSHFPSEFVGSGGDHGIFKLPLRSAVHPGRPPSLELRSHPLRETQVGYFMRTILTASDRQLWAGAESGVKFWNLNDMFSSIDMVTFDTSPALCLIADSANGLVWSGHKDGKIRSWKMEQKRLDDDDDESSFREGLSWQAHHRTPVLSLAVTAYGMVFAFYVLVWIFSVRSCVFFDACSGRGGKFVFQPHSKRSGTGWSM